MIAAYDEKIPVPKILYRTESKSNLGEGFFMEFIEGVALGNKIVDNNFLKSKKVNLSEQCGYHLSKIHKINHKKLENIQKSEAIDEFRKYFEIYKNYNLSIPVFDFSFKWLEKNIPNKSRPTILIKNVNQEKKIIIEENNNLILNLAKLNQIKFLSKQHVENEKSIVTTVDEIILMIPSDGLIDIEAEKNRLSKELENITNEIEIIDKRLNNPSFIEKAPPKVIEDVKTKKTVFDQRKSEINKALLNL